MNRPMKPHSIPRAHNLGKLYRRVDFRVSDERLSSIYHSVLDASALDAEFLSLLALSALIALFGLLQNSAAVIIGAMLISPLMNPILSAALALLLGDGILGKRTGMILGASIVGAILMTWIVALLSPLKQATPEILARTSPNLLDLFIAFLSGLVGTLALRGGPTSLTILPGVAIAVAVIPPLAVVGFGLSTRQWGVAAGAFLLFITNLVSIILSAALVFRLMGFRPHQATEEGHLRLKYRMAISAGVLLLLSIPLVQTLRKAVGQVQLRSEISKELNSAFKTDRSSVSEITFSRVKNGLLIHATVLTSKYFEIPRVKAAEESLKQNFGSGTQLQLDQLLVTQGGISADEALRMQNAISGGVIRPVGAEAPFDIKSAADQVVRQLQKHVDEVLAGTAIQRRGNLRAEWGPAPPLILQLQLVSPEPVQDQTLTLLASQLTTRNSIPIQLHGSVELTAPEYTLRVQSANSRGGLGVQSRRDLTKLALLVQENPALRLQVSCAIPTKPQEDQPPPSLMRELQTLLARSKLDSSQWSVQLVSAPTATGPASSGGTPARAAPAARITCESKTYQRF
jgi:uncharacterized hydrophobic protein (TIGR00271 family)